MNKALIFRRQLILFVIFFSIYPIPSIFAVELSKDEQAYLRSKETIVFVSQTRYPPFEFVDKNNEHAGMCIELARWIATEFGFKAKFTDTFFKQAQQKILAGTADVLTSFFYSKRRDELFDFTHTMFEVPASIFVVAERTDIKDIQDLNGKRIAMQAGDYAKEFLESKNIRFDVVYAKDFAEATDLVIDGKADAVIGDEQIVLYHIFRDNLTEKIKKVGNPLYTGQNCMAAKEGNRMLISILNKGIRLAQKSGVLEKINQKWIGTHYTPRESLLFNYLPQLYIMTGTLLVLSLLIWLWNFRLRQAVKERTRELQKSEGRYRSLTDDVLDSSVVGTVILDSEFKVVWVNRAFECFFSLQRDDVIGKDNRQLIRERIMKVFEEPEIFCEKVLGSYDDNSNFEKSELHVLPANGRRERWLEYWSQPIQYGLYAGGRIEHYSDISVRKQAENDLRRNERFLNAIVENIPDMIFVKESENLRFVRFNKAGEDLLGFKREDLIGRNDHDFFPKTEADFFTEKDREVLYNRTLVDIPEESIHTRYKGERILHTKKIPLIDEKGLPEYLLGISEDITERKIIDDKIVRAKAEWESTFNTVPDLIAIIDNQYRMVRINKAMAEKLGISPDSAAGLTCYEGVHGTKEPPPFCPHNRLLSDGQEHVVEIYEDRLGGVFQVSVTPFHDNEGKLVGSVHVAHDITELKRSEEQIKASLKEKEILLREIHHRVKNNLTVISSLLSMQANILKDRDVHSALQESQSRIKAMALIHETLYQSKSLALIDLEKYAKDLMGNIAHTFEGISGRIRFEIEVHDVKLEVNQAVPCGLIINELATNAIKHAFADAENAVVKIFARCDKNNTIELKVSDNGIGFSKDLDWEKSKSLGMRLISLLVDQLHGTLDISNHHGAEIAIKWPGIVT